MTREGMGWATEGHSPSCLGVAASEVPSESQMGSSHPVPGSWEARRIWHGERGMGIRSLLALLFG